MSGRARSVFAGRLLSASFVLSRSLERFSKESCESCGIALVSSKIKSAF